VAMQIFAITLIVDQVVSGGERSFYHQAIH
jgi:hypothetical protein